MTWPRALLNFAAFESEIWATDSMAGEYARHRHSLSRRAGGCGTWIWYLQLSKQLLKQHVKAAVFNVAEGAEDTGFIVVLFCHVFLCVVSARKYQQGQNNLSSKERERNSEVSKPSSAGRWTFLCPLWSTFPLSHYYPLPGEGGAKPFLLNPYLKFQQLLIFAISIGL